MSQDQDWRITEPQKGLINSRVEKLSKKEGTILIEMIEALFRSRPSSYRSQPDNSRQSDLSGGHN
jgi:hypothetical protein